MDGPPGIFPELADELQLMTTHSNAIAERLVRSLREECLDHILPLSERHVRAVLAEFLSYYNHDRPHRSLTLETPAPSPRQLAGKVVSRAVLNGLHHVYERAPDSTSTFAALQAHLARIQEAYGKPAGIGEQATLSCRVGILGQWGTRRNIEALGVVVVLWRQKEHQTDYSRRAALAEVLDDRVVVPGGPLERS
jgi:Integrase core domain